MVRVGGCFILSAPSSQGTWMMNQGKAHVRLIGEPVATSHWLPGG